MEGRVGMFRVYLAVSTISPGRWLPLENPAL